MILRSLAATLAVAFGLTSLAVFVLVGSYLYVALEQQVKFQSDTDVVLASRHARRLAEEIDTETNLKSHVTRLTSVVLGSQALALVMFDQHGDRLLSHAPEQSVDALGVEPLPPLDAATIPWQPVFVPVKSEILASDIREWTTSQGIRVRSISFDVRLRDGTHLTGVVVRDIRAPLDLLDRYRDHLTIAGIVGSLLTLLASYCLIRLALRPLRQMTADATDVTINRLDHRLPTVTSPSELGELAASFNGMFARLERGYQHLSQFTADLAHDMRTPIGNIRGATEVALQRPRAVEDYENLLASNLEECDRMSRMIENVLFLARTEQPQFVTHMRSFALARELDNISGYFEGLADEGNASIRLACPDGLTLRADLELFRRAIGNVLANAIRYTTPGGIIDINVRVESGNVEVALSNPGVPIQDDDIERIFDRFYRADKARTRSAELSSSGASTGLGLAIVRTIMNLHDGSVAATSRDGITTFTLAWPQR